MGGEEEEEEEGSEEVHGMDGGGSELRTGEFQAEQAVAWPFSLTDRSSMRTRTCLLHDNFRALIFIPVLFTRAVLVLRLRSWPKRASSRPVVAAVEWATQEIGAIVKRVGHMQRRTVGLGLPEAGGEQRKARHCRRVRLQRGEHGGTCGVRPRSRVRWIKNGVSRTLC